MLLPLSGLLLAMSMHAFWNGSSTFGDYGFFAVYAAFMVPAFGLLTWLVIWTRQRELRTVRAELPAYAMAGWLAPAEPYALGSMRARRLAREYARRHLGRPAAREVAQYEAYATSLAFLRHRGRLGRAGADFVVREQELLGELWQRRAVARPALDHAARAVAPAPAPVPPVTAWPPYGRQGYGPTTPYPSYSHVHGHGHSYDPAPGLGHNRPAYDPYPAYNPYRS